jgi:two-component system cell cycle sensor histidine kinase/response regulator CckA
VLDLNAVVSGFDKMVRRLIGDDIKVVTHQTPGLCLVRGDAGQIEQVLMNLVVNARDAMMSGGTLTIETEMVELDESYVSSHLAIVPGLHVMLAVSDTGIGMTPDVQARLFEPFFTTKEAGKGTGLGLATIYGIIRQQGGSIWVYSEAGRGTTFKVYWPVAEARAIVKSETKPHVSVAGTETILVVEDNASLRELTRKILQRQGYTVLLSGNGEEAMRICDEHDGTIALALTDVVMPGVSGRELANHLQHRRPDMRILYMSGYTDDAILHLGVLNAGVPLLEKPFTPGALVAKIRDVLDSALRL